MAYQHASVFERRDVQRIAGTEFPFHLRVPRDYDPTIPTPVFIYMHGGVSRSKWQPGERWWRDDLFPEDALVLSPAAWDENRWWSPQQIDNVHGLLVSLKQQYNVDDNRIYVFGVSDGAAGAYYFGMRDVTPYAGIVSIIGHPAVLYNKQANRDVAPPLPNLANLPVLTVNGAEDPLYPVATLTAYFERFSRLGIEFESNIQAHTGHELKWTDAVQQNLADFVKQHPRTPHPPRVYWEVGPDRMFARAHWLHIDEVDPTAKRACVDAEWHGSSFVIQSEGVRALSLLVPSTFDYALPIDVTINGSLETFEPTAPDLTTLLRWHSKDFDRAQLYGREINLNVSSSQPATCRK